MRALCVIEGDGIGREVVPAALQVVRALLPEIEVVPAEAGWECFTRRGVSVPGETLTRIRACGAALFGAVASPGQAVAGYRSAIVTMRQALGLFANLRPTRSLPLPGARPDVNLFIVRENTEGLYSGRERWVGEGEAVAERVTIVHKGNILPVTDGLFCQSVRRVAQTYPEIAVDDMLVDTAAMWLARAPERFDVLVTTNLFGDILSDVAAVWGGGLGVAPSLNLGEGIAIAEPVHGAAPDIAGQGQANPIAAILSAALLLRHVWHEEQAASAIEQAVCAVLAAGIRTPDIAAPGDQVVDTVGMTRAIVSRLGAVG